MKNEDFIKAFEGFVNQYQESGDQFFFAHFSKEEDQIGCGNFGGLTVEMASAIIMYLVIEHSVDLPGLVKGFSQFEVQKYHRENDTTHPK